MTRTKFLARLHGGVERICEETHSGRLSSGCSMSATNSAIKEVWSTTEDLPECATLNSEEQDWLLSSLNENFRAELIQFGIDEFGLVYEYLQQATLPSERPNK